MVILASSVSSFNLCILFYSFLFFSILSIEAFRLYLLGVFTMKISAHFPPVLRQRINEDMRLRKFAVKTQISYIRAINRLCEYLQHSPENTTREELRKF